MSVLGVDVAKTKREVSLLHPDTDQSRFKTVPNTSAGFAGLQGGLGRQGVADLAPVHRILEATGVCHEAAARWFVEAGAAVSVVNPAPAKAFGQGLAVRTQTDARDSPVLAR